MNDDALKQVFIHCSREYKGILFTCRRFAHLIAEVFPLMSTEPCYHLSTLQKRLPKQWESTNKSDSNCINKRCKSGIILIIGFNY